MVLKLRNGQRGTLGDWGSKFDHGFTFSNDRESKRRKSRELPVLWLKFVSVFSNLIVVRNQLDIRANKNIKNQKFDAESGTSPNLHPATPFR